MNPVSYHKRLFLAVGAVLALVLLLWGSVKLHKALEQRRWLGMGPIKNHPQRIYDVKFAREFNDLNDVQLQVAQALGVAPVEDREAAEKLKNLLVLLEDNDLYVVDSLSHSIPYLVPRAKDLLDRIGRNFQDSLCAKGLNPNKFVVTSVLRTNEDVRRLRRRNTNASENSAHRYGTFLLALSKGAGPSRPSLRRCSTRVPEGCSEPSAQGPAQHPWHVLHQIRTKAKLLSYNCAVIRDHPQKYPHSQRVRIRWN